MDRVPSFISCASSLTCASSASSASSSSPRTPGKKQHLPSPQKWLGRGRRVIVSGPGSEWATVNEPSSVHLALDRAISAAPCVSTLLLQVVMPADSSGSSPRSAAASSPRSPTVKLRQADNRSLTPRGGLVVYSTKQELVLGGAQAAASVTVPYGPLTTAGEL